MQPADPVIMGLLPFISPLIIPCLSSIPAIDPPIGRISLPAAKALLPIMAHFAPGCPSVTVSIHKD